MSIFRKENENSSILVKETNTEKLPEKQQILTNRTKNIWEERERKKTHIV